MDIYREQLTTERAKKPAVNCPSEVCDEMWDGERTCKGKISLLGLSDVFWG